MKKVFLILSILFCKTISAQVNLDSSLVACYALNGHAAEPINGLDGILHNVYAVVDRNNVANSAMNFSCNANSFAELPNTTLLKSQVLSFSAWIKLGPSFFSKGFILFTKNASNNLFEAYSLTINDSSNGKRFRVSQASATNSISIETSLPVIQNTWYHIAFTMDTNVLQLYLNGVLQNTAAIVGATNFSANKNVYFGGTHELGHNQPFCGVIDNARFYNRVITAYEINQLYLNDPACLTSTASPVALVMPGTVQCVGQPITMTNLTTNNPTNYLWEAPSALISNLLASNPTLTYNAVGTYTYKMIATNALGSDTAFGNIIIKPLPFVSIHSTSTITCRWLFNTLTGLGANTYTWGLGVSGTSVIINPQNTTTFTVLGEDTLGCINSASIKINVVSDCWPTNTRDDVSIEERIFISPNPSDGKFIIESLNLPITEYFLYDVAGEIIFQKLVENAHTFEIDISEYPQGIYILHLSACEKVKRVKLIKN